jgi:dipeptidyl aminopeptidase/acylaminoacyl peptidase
MNPDGSDLRRLTSHAKGSSHPRWSHDSKSIYFLSGRGGSSQVWVIPIDGGEATAATDLPLDVGCFAVSPTGNHLAVAMEVFPDAETIDDTVRKLDAIKEQKHSGQVYDQLFVRHWDTWKDGRRSHLFAIPTGAAAKADDAVDLMRGMVADAPSKPFGGAEEFTFTPDGTGVVFACRDRGREEAWSTAFDLYLAPVDGGEGPRMIASGHGATLTSPVFSRDGKKLAWLTMKRAGYEADRLRLAVMDWPGGEPRIVSEGWDRSPHSIEWNHADTEIYTSADDLGHHPLFAIDVESGSARRVLPEGFAGKVTAIALAKDRLVFGRCHHQSPTELYTIAAKGEDPVQVTTVNAEKLAACRMGESEQFTFKGWNGETVHAWIVRPIDFDPSRKYPVAFLIHGGPQGSFGNDFHYRWNPQTYAGAGYAAIMVDFHGSTGYGQAFTDAINGHWGDRPFEDLQKGLAAAFERYDWLDHDRVGALGASFGGYMINWIHGNWQDPFKCFVCHDGNIDERMAYYDTEELWFPEWEHQGTAWEKPESYTHHNPIDHIGRWRTPTLIVHGAKDYRVVDTQGISAFTALQRLGVPSRLLYFPDENHWVLKPNNSIQWHEEVIGWLDRWLKP